MSDGSPFLVVSEVAARWRTKDQHVRDLIAARAIVAYKIGGRWLLRLEDVENYERTRRGVHSVKKRTRLPRRPVRPRG